MRSRNMMGVSLMLGLVGCVTSTSPLSDRKSLGAKAPQHTAYKVFSRYQKDPLPPQVQVVDAVRVSEAMEKKESFMLTLSLEQCPSSKLFWQRDLKAYQGPWKLYIIHVDATQKTSNTDVKQLEDVFRWGSSLNSSYYLFKEGRLVDASVASLSQFMTRQSGARIAYDELKRPGKDAKSRRKNAVIQGQMPYMDLSGVNLSGLKLTKRNYEGSDLRNADFREAKLTHVNFSYANLQGVSFKGASLENIFWGGAICPDGHHANPLDPEGCMAHLEPKRIAGIQTDPPASQTESVVKQMELLDALNGAD